MSTHPSLEHPVRIRSLVDVEQLEQTPWQDIIPATNTYDLLRLACQKYGEKIALRQLTSAAVDAVTKDQSYSDLMQSVNRAANALYAVGVTPTTPIAILLPNVLENHWALWAAQACGIASPINAMLETDYIARICEETGAEVVITSGPQPHSNVWEKMVEVAKRVPKIKTILAVNHTEAHVMDIVTMQAELKNSFVRVLDFHAALAAALADKLAFQRTCFAADPCAYFHTGGTTGYPKVAVHTHGNEAFMAWVLESFIGQGNVVLSGLPLFHVNGAIVTGLAAFHSGSEVVLLTSGGFRTSSLLDNFWALANRFGATLFSAVPTIYAALAHKPLPPSGLRTLRRGVCGAAPLPPQVAIDFEQATGIRLYEGYGMTEGTCVSTSNSLFAEPAVGTVGIRVPYQQLGVFNVDDQGRAAGQVAMGKVGVIGIHGPNIFTGYLRSKDNANIWLADGWFNTGDLGRLNSEGQLTLCGRAKDLIIRGGHNIDPAIIEDALTAHPAIAMAAAVGQPDTHAGEIPVAYVALKPAHHAELSDLVEYAKHAVPERAAVPVRIEILPALPMTAVGKISKPHLRLQASQFAVKEALSAAQLEGISLDGSLSPEKGVVVQISCAKEKTQAVRTLLGRLPLHLEFKEN